MKQTQGKMYPLGDALGVKETGETNKVLRQALRDLRGENALLLAAAMKKTLWNRRLLMQLRLQVKRVLKKSPF